MPVGSLSLEEIVFWHKQVFGFIVPFFPLFLMYFISILAETNRPPWSSGSCEGELVAGYNIEYSSVGFTLFFLAEYSNLLFYKVV